MKVILKDLPENILSKLVLSINPQSIDIMSGFGGLCLIAPNEEVVGLMSFDAIDDAIDRIEDQIVL